MSDIARLNKLLSDILSPLRPAEGYTVSEWAAKKRYLSGESSAESGIWRNERTPYLVDVMDSFNDPNVRHIVMVAASQVGKSEFINNVLGYVIDQEPSSVLFIHPTMIDARQYSKERIAPMIRDTPCLRRKVSEPKSRTSENTILQKQFKGGILTLCGSTEAHALASKPIRIVLGDERDRWAVSAGKEGDPWQLAMARQTTFYNAKSIEVSTPTIKGASAIEAAYKQGTMERWKTQCPSCKEFHSVEFEDIRFEHSEEVEGGIRRFTIWGIHYVCPNCGAKLTEKEVKNAHAEWVAENPEAYEQGVRSFWLNAFVSRWTSWEGMILEFLQAKNDFNKLQAVFNTRFGKLWEQRGEVQNEEGLLARREEYGAELPDGVLVLTCGVDTQDDRLEYEILGHGYFGETWGIKYGVILGRPDENETWKKLDEVIEKVHTFSDGVGLKVSTTFVDEGGHFTQDVREQCRVRATRRVYCVKGLRGNDTPYTAPPKKQKIQLGGKVTQCWQFQLGVSAGKQIIMSNLRVEEAGANYCHFPRRDDYGKTYFAGLVSEQLVRTTGKREAWNWEKIPGHERNEPLDCRNYALAAFRALSPNLDAEDKKIRERRNLVTTGEVPKVENSVEQATHTKKRRIQPPRKVRYYDEW